MIKYCHILVILFFSFNSFGQIFEPVLNINQSTSSINWKKIDNEFVEVIYPDYLEEKAQYIAQLIQHFHPYVGQTYGIEKPKKFTLIIRSEMSTANGFVTLGPKRSEWFSSANINPFIGAVDWYQTLAIHEYRHLNQYDTMNKSYNNFLHMLFGDLGLQVGIFLTADSWFFEGDAVWTETKYTDAGRGRSPRFSARLRSILTSNLKIPTYDEFLMGDYNNPLPNQYVYGYYLISRAVKIYGEDVWKNTIKDSANSFYNFWRFYNSFELITGKKFEKFFDETMLELKTTWSLETKNKKSHKEYIRYSWPKIDKNHVYALRRTLDSFWELYEIDSKREVKITELNINPSISKVDLKKSKFVYVQDLPTLRFGYKGSSDLFIFDLLNKKNQRITNGKRYYHPSFNAQGDKIVATSFGEENQWELHILDLKGNILKIISIKDMILSEAIFKDEKNLIVIAQVSGGHKNIQLLNLDTYKLTPFFDYTRNNLYAINLDHESVYFEADINGRVNILSYNLKENSLAQCGEPNIAEYQPHGFNGDLYRIAESVNGLEILKSKNLCTPLNKDTLKNINYISKNSPSDHYNDFKLMGIQDYQVLESSKVTNSDYTEFKNLLNLHSWSFIGGRGFQLQGTSNNYLNTMAIDGAIGHNSSEQRGFYNLGISYSKYFPIFSLGFDYSERNFNYDETKYDRYSDGGVIFDISLPFIKKINLYNQSILLNSGFSHREVSNRENANTYELSNEGLDILSGSISYSVLKDLRYREITTSSGFSFLSTYKNAEAKEDKQFSNYYFYNRMNLYTKGFFANNTIKFTAEDHKHKKNYSSYRFISNSSLVNQNILSRGYDYFYTPELQKATLNYYFPISYAQFGFRDYFHFNRVYGNFFYDHSKASDDKDFISMNSYGTEITLESLTFRKLPLAYTFRILYNELEKKTVGEVYFGINQSI